MTETRDRLAKAALLHVPFDGMNLAALRAGAPNIATRRIKWDLEYQKRVGLEISRAREIDPALEARVQQVSKRVFSLLNMTGWGRMDFRVTADGQLYVLEANPNGDIAYGEEFASSAEAAGYTYPALLQRVINIGLRAAGK